MTARLGTPRLHLRKVDSTNLRARELAAAGALSGTLVTADEQLAGRGRQGRAWSSPPGTSLAMSLIFRDPPPILSLAVGVAVARTVDIALEAGDAIETPDAVMGTVSKSAKGVSAFRHGSPSQASTRSGGAPGSEGVQSGASAQIKWPNDVLIAGRKVAGILVEARPQDGWAVLGIGINVAVEPDQLPDELRARAASLKLPRTAIEPTLARLLAELDAWLQAPTEHILAAVRERDALLGALVTWAQGSGVGAGIDEQGRLRVALQGGGEQTLDAGEVHLQAG